ncbi:acetyl-CoA carboxylase biotin carboxyl carrier protein subunit [Globicatella sp. PHS-GS-PNBC-21-1553]|uniref:acetyl-CoA carboxylase biotin carboxyl carrier protein subunit n=1 Tax=Globicatella sp. PHS-GS-PNBC-21-1553 TaxID=2885764 RepID=UPI00298EEF1C|nr:acetyl-CoA carboxylase biotin carboxyl carrier protein subunit [Globicatella sp. PHS-GS-PNBC-21-1553]WPC09699.1 acetyl-CoA carboxylase biotin carboxyl carrier protein subunit [Globicatella sp. PHS-GS-PNBC-21-1553]
MLRKFKITIDGKEYLVEMEEIGGAAPTAEVAPTPPVAPAAPVPSSVEEKTEDTPPVAPAAPVADVPAGVDAMKAPMPGTITKILVNVGDSVAENQPLMILEAMKMENEIVSGRAGTVQSIHVNPGQTVNPGDALVVIG